jgi:hypothetical protein
VRGLVDSDFDSPLREFDGNFDGYETAPASGYDGTRVELRFKDLDNVIATSPYIFPTAVINIGLSNKKTSRWGYFAQSITEIISADEDIKDQVGKTFHMMLADGEDGRIAKKPSYKARATAAELALYPDKMVPTAVWVCTAIDGASAAVAKDTKSAANIAEELLIGKTRAEFNKQAYANPAIRKDVELQRSITDKSFVNTLVKLGKVVEDENGVFQRPA